MTDESTNGEKPRKRPRTNADAGPESPPKRKRGAQAANRNAVKSGRHAKKNKPKDLGWADQKKAERSAKLEAWERHVRRIRREGRELTRAWGLRDDGGSKVLGQELARARILLHRLDERNITSLTTGGGQLLREQNESARVVAAILAKLMDRARELMPEDPALTRLILQSIEPDEAAREASRDDRDSSSTTGRPKAIGDSRCEMRVRPSDNEDDELIAPDSKLINERTEPSSDESEHDIRGLLDDPRSHALIEEKRDEHVERGVHPWERWRKGDEDWTE